MTSQCVVTQDDMQNAYSTCTDVVINCGRAREGVTPITQRCAHKYAHRHTHTASYQLV